MFYGTPQPTSSSHRDAASLDGTWNFVADRDDAGGGKNYHTGLPASKSTTISVPASWNEQLPELDGFLGPAWYERTFWTPRAFVPGAQRCLLRFASVNYSATVFVDGEEVGGHEGGHLPFEVDVTRMLGSERTQHRLVVRVDGRLQREHVPPGGGWGGMAPGCFPNASFDFYPFCGIQRGVLLCVRPRVGLVGLALKCNLDSPPETKAVEGLVLVDDESRATLVVHAAAGFTEARPRPSSAAPQEIDDSLYSFSATLIDAAGAEVAHLFADRAAAEGPGCELALVVQAPKLWAPGTPVLHTLRIKVIRSSSGEVIDAYEQPVGLRTVEVKGDALLLNGAPVQMKGFGRHEDAPLIGRGECGAVLVRDHEIMRWCGSNSYRTAHYPYSEVDLDLADRRGVLVVSESACVGLSFGDEPEWVRKRQANAEKAVRELLERDLTRTCVVAWSVCNEPGGPLSLPGPEARALQSEGLRSLVALAKRDGSRRPVTFANVPEHCDEANRECDFLSLNEYAGWYYDVGKPLDQIRAELLAKFERLHADFGKPMMISECGADTLAGCHMVAPGLWSEEFQMELMGVYASLLGAKPWLFGVHFWNLTDFRSTQMHIRAGGLNMKGLFTRDRQPKMAAHHIRKLWAAA